MGYEQELKDLCKAYSEALPEKLSLIQAEWNHLKQDNKMLSDELIRKIHSLIGAGTTFGFPSLSNKAKELEWVLLEYQKQNTLASQYTDKLEPLFAALESAAQQPCDYAVTIDIQYPLFGKGVADNNTPSILIISNHSLLVADLVCQLKRLKMTSHVLGSSSNLQAAIEQTNPACIVLELTSKQNPVDEIKIIRTIAQRFYKKPALIVISSHHDINARLSAVKAGATAYFISPANALEIAKSIDSQCYPAITPPYRVLIVDDDEQTAHHTALILQRSGTNIESQILTDPLNILQSLESFRPEVILLDLYMPECSGIELATVIRQQCLYANIAIIFFSVETAIERHIDALRAGGDDFLVKSTPARQLITKIEAKAKNTRTLQSLLLNDPLTGLLNRSHFTDMIAQQIALSRRSQGYFSYAVLALDYFKQVNDQHGHAIGDETLKALAKLAKQRFRSVDNLFRFGTEEFVFLLPNTQAQQAELVITDLLQKFTEMTFFSKAQTFSMSFSAGVAQYPDYLDPSSLADAAHSALFQAKKMGRKRVCQAS